MPTETTTEWTPYCGQYLGMGYEVKLHPRSARDKVIYKNTTGIVERKLRKNISIVIDGKKWSVPPAMIESYRRGDPSNLDGCRETPDESKVTVTCNPEGLQDCKDGDILLMYRGKFDVVELVTLDGIRCRVVGKDKIYKYKAELFVQKLDAERFS